MKKNIIIILSVIIIAVLLRYTAGSISGFLAGQMEKKRPAPSVLVEPIKEEYVTQSFDAPGRIVAKYQVNVLARINGYLQQSYFKEGDYVKEGQVLFLIEPTEYMNTLNITKGEMENTKAQLVYAEKQLIRAKELVKRDYIAKAKYDEILAQRDALRAKLASNQATYKDSQRNYSYTHVKAPVSGKISLISVTKGNYVTPSAGPLTTINSTNPIYVTFPLSSKDFNTLNNTDLNNNKSRKVELYFNDGSKYELSGVQEFQDNKIDQATGTITLRATFQNPDDRLIHGDFVNIKIYSNNKVKVPVVPQTAVLENQAGQYVYKIDANGLPELTYVKLSGQTGKNWIVTEGLKSGDKVITDGLQKVTPQKPVTIVSVEEMEKIKKEYQNNEEQ